MLTAQPAAAEAIIDAEQDPEVTADQHEGYGPQSPRDIDHPAGDNPQVFGLAPEATKMTLCNIHLHESAEHKGGDFTTPAKAASDTSGFRYDGTLTAAERAPLNIQIGQGENGELVPGDTIEAHFVYSTARATLGQGLGNCFTEATQNPQLRVEAVIAVLVNDADATDFTQLAQIEDQNGLAQLPNLPDDLGAPVVYNGSTTGPAYAQKASPIQVTWSVRPKVEKVDIRSLGAWLRDNPFLEVQAHGVRGLVTDPALLSQIE